MNLPDDGILALFIDREVEVDCGGCYGCKPNKPEQIRIVLAGGTPHNACHGTGRITRRLRGWVEVVASHRGGAAQMRTLDGLYNIGGETFEGLHKGLVDSIVASYLTGTLPDANITWGQVTDAD